MSFVPLRLMSGVGLLALVVSILGCQRAEDGSSPATVAKPGDTDYRAYSVQLHVHGSFSEGVGSVDSHSHQASELDLDAIWWSDHDFRIASYHHASTFGFEGWREPMDRGEQWVALGPRERALEKEISEHRHQWLKSISVGFTGLRAYEGERSLRIDSSSESSDFQRHSFYFRANNSLHRRPLAANLTLRLAILPERSGRDGRAFVRVQMSEHPSREGLPFAPYNLHYYLDNLASGPFREGITYFVPLHYIEGEWNVYSLPLTRDAIAGFSFIDGEDNSLNIVSLGVEARRGARVSALFDSLRIGQELGGKAVYERQRVIIGRVGETYPELHQLQGVEISLQLAHLNEFSLRTELLDYDELTNESGLFHGSPPSRDTVRKFNRFAIRRAVEIAHQKGGLISYNHMYGVSEAGERRGPLRSRQEVLDDLLQNRAFQADILEVGYRDRGGHALEDHLWVWDELAKAQLLLVGVGVSDSHGGPSQRWVSKTNNFVTWIHAASPRKSDLLEGMRAGRVFFGDLMIFDGTMELTTSRGDVMGQIVLTDRDEEELTIDIAGLAKEDRIHIIESGRRTETIVASGAKFRSSQRIPLSATGGGFVRVEVYDAAGTAKVFSNPIHFLRTAPAGGIPPARAAVDVAGVFSRNVEGFRIRAAEVVDEGDGEALRLTGSADNGTITLDYSDFASAIEVRLENLSGTWTVADQILTLKNIAGSGAVIIARRPQ